MLHYMIWYTLYGWKLILLDHDIQFQWATVVNLFICVFCFGVLGFSPTSIWWAKFGSGSNGHFLPRVVRSITYHLSILRILITVSLICLMIVSNPPSINVTYYLKLINLLYVSQSKCHFLRFSKFFELKRNEKDSKMSSTSARLQWCMGSTF